MARNYTLKKRAEQQAETRRRIVEAAVDLHTEVGPALTTMTMLAERAGVQRHTLYAHFPDERAVQNACSAMAFERDPPPDAAGWHQIGDQRQRLRGALGSLYEWYGRNARLTGCVLRDAEYHAPTRETVERTFAPYFEGYQKVLGEGLGPDRVAMLRLAMSFFTWRTLVQEEGLDSAAAVEAMVEAVRPAGSR